MTSSATECPVKCGLLRVNIPMNDGVKRSEDAALIGAEGNVLFLKLNPVHLDFQRIEAGVEWVLSCHHGSLIDTHRARLITLDERGEAKLCITAAQQLQSTRRSERVEINVSLRSWLESESWMRLHDVQEQSIVLSQNGILFMTGNHFRIGDRIGIEFHLPKRHDVSYRFSANVLSSTILHDQFQIVAEFRDLDSSLRGRLDALLLTGQFQEMGQRVKLLGSVFSPSLASEKHEKG